MAEWNEAEHPRDELGRFTDKDGFYRANTPYYRLKDTIPLPDEQLPRSVGAKWANYVRTRALRFSYLLGRLSFVYSAEVEYYLAVVPG